MRQKGLLLESYFYCCPIAILNRSKIKMIIITIRPFLFLKNDISNYRFRNDISKCRPVYDAF